MIEISGLSKTYGGKQALDDVSFRAEQGKVTALIGPAQEKPEQERKRAEVFYKRSQKTV